jgi:hypothetical protein
MAGSNIKILLYTIRCLMPVERSKYLVCAAREKRYPRVQPNVAFSAGR